MELSLGCCCGGEEVPVWIGRPVKPIGDGAEWNRTLGANQTEITDSWVFSDRDWTLGSPRFDSWNNFLQTDLDTLRAPITQNLTVYLSKALRFRITDRAFADFPSTGLVFRRPSDIYRTNTISRSTSTPAAGHLKESLVTTWKIQAPLVRRGDGGTPFTTHAQLRVDGVAITDRIPCVATARTLLTAAGTQWGCNVILDSSIPLASDPVDLSESIVEVDIWCGITLTPGSTGYVSPASYGYPAPEQNYALAGIGEFSGQSISNPNYSGHPKPLIQWTGTSRYINGSRYKLTPNFDFKDGVTEFNNTTWTVTTATASKTWTHSGGLHKVILDWAREVPEVRTWEPHPSDVSKVRWIRYVPSGGTAAFQTSDTGNQYPTPTTWTWQAAQDFVIHSFSEPLFGGDPDAAGWGPVSGGQPFAGQEWNVSK